MEKQKLLVTLDEHSISMELVKYLGKIISGNQDLEVCLLQMLPPPPPQLHSANEWSGVATKMVAHVGVAEIGNPREIQVPKQQEMTLILTYLEANACEVDD